MHQLPSHPSSIPCSPEILAMSPTTSCQQCRDIEVNGLRNHSFLVGVALFLFGVFATLGWSPVEQVWIAWIGFSVLVVFVARDDNPARAFTRGFCFALGLHTAGHGWAFAALLKQTDAGLIWSLMGTMIFLVYLSMFLAIPAACCNWLLYRLTNGAENGAKVRGPLLLWAITLAIAWSGAEALRGMLFNGFDSLAAGYMFSAWPLRGWVPVLGVYGCSLLFYVSSALVGAAWVTMSGSFRWSAALGCVSGMILLGGGSMLDTVEWVHSTGNPLSFRLIQGGVPQKTKFDANAQDGQVAAYVAAISAAPADLIVTPETAFPIDLTEVKPAQLAKLLAFSSATGSNLFVGAPQRDADGRVRNSMFHIAPRRVEMPRYDKTRLMPFGEYAPMGFVWFTQRMSVALNDQSPGLSNQAPFEVQGPGGPVPVGVLICHEDLSYSDARRWAANTNALINPGNLAWFEGSLALPQRLQIARVRALETGRPLLRTTNTGVTAHVDAKGHVVSFLPPDAPGVLNGKIQPTAGLTPFARYGNLLVAVLGGALMLAALVVGRVRRP
jgi:apolipoprotein N-acyltransferase